MTVSVPQIIARLRQATGADSDADLARKLGLSAGSVVSNWQRRDTVPLSECLRIASERGISLDWLLLGRGPMTATREGCLDAQPYSPRGGCAITTERGADCIEEDRPRVVAEAPREPLVQAVGRRGRWQRWQDDWWGRASSDERTWMDVQLQRSFPEYAAWVASGRGRALEQGADQELEDGDHPDPAE